MKKKDSPWFSHDCDAASDPKCIALISAYGWEGYGRWWAIVEMLRKQERYRYNISSKFSWPSLGQPLGMSVDEIKKFIEDLIKEFDLLQTDNDFIWSESLLERMVEWDEKRATLSGRGKKGAAVTNEKKRLAREAAEAEATQKEEAKQKEELSQYTPEQVASYNSFKEWVKANAPKVMKMDKFLTIGEYLALFKDFDKEFVKTLLIEMHNYKPLVKNNVSTNLTFRKWAAKRHNDKKTDTGHDDPNDADAQLRELINRKNDPKD